MRTKFTMNKGITTIVILTVCFITSCSKDDPSAREKKRAMLTAGVWVTEQVLNSSDGDLTASYSGFSIVFLKGRDVAFEGDYFVHHGGHTFTEAAGQWKFSNDLKKLILSDGKEIDFTLTKESLTLYFFLEPTGGRLKGLSGNFTFVLKQQN